MPINTLSDLLTALRAPDVAQSTHRAVTTASVVRLASGWSAASDVLGGSALTAPTTAAALYDTSPGAQEPPDAAADRRLISLQPGLGNTSAGYPVHFLLIDRLCHQGGLVHNVGGAQTTNLPTAALPRYASGEGVLLGLEIYGSIGSSGSAAVSASYTAPGVGPGRTAGPRRFSNSETAAAELFLLPLQYGDSGVLSVESVTVTNPTGTAGNFGVVLFKPLAMLSALSSGEHQILWLTGGFAPKVLSGAHLQLLRLGGTATSTIAGGRMSFVLE